MQAGWRTGANQFNGATVQLMEKMGLDVAAKPRMGALPDALEDERQGAKSAGKPVATLREHCAAGIRQGSPPI